MALAADQLQGWRDLLFAARMRGVRTFRDQNGEEVTFTSDREMAAALAACDRELAALAGGRVPHTIILRTSKGI